MTHMHGRRCNFGIRNPKSHHCYLPVLGEPTILGYCCTNKLKASSCSLAHWTNNQLIVDLNPSPKSSFPGVVWAHQPALAQTTLGLVWVDCWIGSRADPRASPVETLNLPSLATLMGLGGTGDQRLQATPPVVLGAWVSSPWRKKLFGYPHSQPLIPPLTPSRVP